jgi:hypothetical protein
MIRLRFIGAWVAKEAQEQGHLKWTIGQVNPVIVLKKNLNDQHGYMQRWIESDPMLKIANETHNLKTAMHAFFPL